MRNPHLILEWKTTHLRMAYWLTNLPSIAEGDEDDTEEQFLTVSLDGVIWMEDPVLERHLCIHEN